MAIPKSTFVMGVVTLGLFGLAVRETATKDTARGDDEQSDEVYDDEDAEAELKRWEAERAQREAQREAEEAEAKAKTATSVNQLLGAEGATPGPLFSGFRFGMTDTEMPPELASRIRTWEQTTESAIRFGEPDQPAAMTVIRIAPGENAGWGDRDSMCEAIEESLTRAWGSGNSLDDSQIWLNPVTKIRATYHHGSRCSLEFEPYVTPAEWIGNTLAAPVPRSLVGLGLDKAMTYSGESADETGQLTWWRAGVGIGTGRTVLLSEAKRGRVTAVTASTKISDETAEALNDHLIETYGEPVRDNQDGGFYTLRWKRHGLEVRFAASGEVSAIVTKAP